MPFNNKLIYLLKLRNIMTLLCSSLLILVATSCSLSVDDITGPAETADDIKTQKQLNKLRKKYKPVIGRYKGIFHIRKMENNKEFFEPVPFEMRLHILPFNNGYKSDGSPIEIPRLIGHINFLEEIVHEVEYVPFIVSYNAISGQLNLNFEPKNDDSIVPSTVIQGELLGSTYTGQYFTPDGEVGYIELKKFSNTVPSFTPEEVAEQKREAFASMFSHLQGDYLGKIKNPKTKEVNCVLITLFPVFSKEVQLRAYLQWSLSSGLNIPMEVTYSPFTDEIIFSPQQLPNGSISNITAHGTFKNEILDLPRISLNNGTSRSFRAKRYNFGKSPIQNPIKECRNIKL